MNLYHAVSAKQLSPYNALRHLALMLPPGWATAARVTLPGLATVCVLRMWRCDALRARMSPACQDSLGDEKAWHAQPRAHLLCAPAVCLPGISRYLCVIWVMTHA